MENLVHEVASRRTDFTVVSNKRDTMSRINRSRAEIASFNSHFTPLLPFGIKKQWLTTEKAVNFEPTKVHSSLLFCFFYYKQFEKQFKKGHRPGGPDFKPGYGPKPFPPAPDREVPPPADAEK